MLSTRTLVRKEEPQTACDPGAGLFLEERPMLPQWGPKARAETPPANTDHEAYWSPQYRCKE